MMVWSFQGPAFVALVLLYAVSVINARECKIGCQEGSSGSILKYEPGKVYKYKFEGNSVTKLAGATSSDQNNVGISADVEVSQLTTCEHVLKVTNVQVSAPDSKKFNLGELSQQPVKFGLHNGHIDSELCVNPSEDTAALNIKRAVLSLIQSSVLKDNGYASQTEVDVSGSCPTEFEFFKSGSTIKVKKSRDLIKCAQREDISVSYLSTPYYVKSEIQSSPLLLSTFEGEQKIEGGSLKYATREEQYEYKPGAAPEAAVTVVVKSSLTFVNAAAGSIQATCTEPRSIIFESENVHESTDNVGKIVELVRQGCDSRAVGDDTAQKFSLLVRTVASSSKQDIVAALKQINSGSEIKEKDTAQKMLKDAIVMAQSASSVEVMAEILKKKEVSETTAKVWLLALGSVRHASRASLTAVLPLLDSESDVNAYLGIGSLAGKYCSEHSCEGVNEVNQLQIKLGAPLLKGCRANNKKEENLLIASLKGLSNIKYLGPKIAGKIVECAEDRYVRPRVRSAALETIRTDANKEQFKNLALNILKNIDEDSELRIKAYLILAQCPCGKIAAAVKDLLNKEESNQVGGFIVSHLRNLQASTNPDKQAARRYLGTIIPPRKFVLDPKRYSVNQELSYSADIINTGAAGEANIIYSQNSFIPRTLSLNLTVQLFGTAYNLLEFDTRAENLEYVAERIFGPKGYLKTNKVEDMEEDAKDAVSSLMEKIASRYDQVLRPKRSITREHLNALASKVNYPKGSDDIDLDLSLKVLGSEVLWQHLHGTEVKKIEPKRIIDKYFDSVESLIDSLKNTNIDYRKHVSFLDEEVTYPTSLGLPLKLKSLGSAALRMKLDGKFDIPAILKDPQNTHVRLQFLPSAAINVAGEVSIDAIAVEVGTQVDLNLYSSTGSDVTFKLLSGNGFDVKFGLPVSKQEIVSVKVDMKSIVRNNGQVVTAPIKYDTKRETYGGCFDQLNPLVGLTFCGTLNLPYESGHPIYPMYGPVDFNILVLKEDESFSGYHIKALHERKEDIHSVELLFDTPDSSTSRKFSLLVEGSNGQHKFANVKVISPWTDLELNADLTLNNQEKSLNAKLIHDKMEYNARVGVTVSGSGNKHRYEPIFEYKAPEGAKSALIGKKGGSKTKQQSFGCSGYITEETVGSAKKFKIHEVALSTPRTKYIVDGSVTLDQHQASSDLKISFDKEEVDLHGKFQSDMKNELHTELAVTSTTHPELGFSITYDVLKDKPKPGKYDSKFALVHGPDPNSQVTRLFIHNSYEKVVKNGKVVSGGFHHEVTYPALELELMLEGYFSPSSLSGGFKGKFDKYSAMLKSSGELNSKQVGDFSLKLDGELMGNEFKLESSRTVEGSDKSKFKNVLILKPGGTYKLNAVVLHKFSSEEVHFQVDADATLFDQPNIKVVAGYSTNGNSCNGNFKVNVGDKCLVEEQHALIRGPTPSGHYKLVLTGYLESEGKLTSDNSNVNGVATVFLPKIDRKLEAKAGFSLNAPNYSGDISLCYDTKDPQKTIKIQTVNSLSMGETDSSLNSKNSFSHGEFELKANLNGKVTQHSLNRGNTLVEVEFILPNKYQMGGKFTKSFNFEGEHSEAEAVLELHDQGEGLATQKLKLSAVGKHLSLNEGTVDGQAQLIYTSREGKDTNAHVNLKKLPNSNGKTSNVNGEVGISGDLIASPFTFKYESEISNEYFEIDDSVSFETDLPFFTYKATGSLGQDLNFEAAGKLNGPSIANEFIAKFPESTPIKSLKVVSNNLIDIADDNNEHSKVKLNNAVHWNDKHIEVNVEGHSEKNGLQYVVEYGTDSLSKRRVAGSLHFSEEDGKADASVNLSFDGKTADLSGKVEVNKDKTAANVHISSNLPEQGKVDITYRQKVVKDGHGFHADLSATSKDKKLTGNVKVELDKDHPLIELNLVHPEGESRLFYKADKKGDRHYASEMNVKWTVNGGGSLSADSEANLASIDNFFLKANVDSAQLDLKKIHVDISNKPAKGEAKKITFTIKSDDKIKVSGSTNYNYKVEGDTATLEGTGNVKFEDQSYPLTFQATRQLSDTAQLGKLSIKAGKRSLNWEGKLTPNELFIERTYCKEPKQCSKAEIKSKIIKNDLEEEEYSVVVALDLSLFSSNLHDISYKSNYKRKMLLVDHGVELQYAKNSKLKYHAFIKEKSAGAYLTLPKRTIGGEVKYDISKKKENVVSMKVEVEAYLNKGKDPKLYFVAASKAQYDKGTTLLAGETKLSHPSLAKDLIVRGQVQVGDSFAKLYDGILEIDVSKDPKNKLVSKLKMTGSKDNMHTVFTIKSEGCKIDITYEEELKYLINGKDSHFLVSESIVYTDSKNTKHELLAKTEYTSKKFVGILRVPELAVFEADYAFDKGYTGSLKIFGKHYRENLKFDKSSNLVQYQLSGLEGGKTLNVEATFKIGSTGSFKASLDNKKVCSFDVALDETNFLKSKYSYDVEAAKSIYAALTTEAKVLAKEGTKALTVYGEKQIEDLKHLSNCLGRVLPDSHTFEKHLQSQLKAIKDEIANDKSAQEAYQLLKEVSGTFGEQFVVIVEELNKFFSSIAQLLRESAEQLKAIVTEILPKVKESLKRITKVLNELFEQYLQLSVKFVDLVLNEIKKNENDIKQLADATSHYLQEIGKVVGKIVITVDKEVEQFIKQNIETLSDLPIVADLEKYLGELKNFQVPEELYVVFHEATDLIKSLIPTDESTTFFDNLQNVVSKILRHEEIENRDEVLNQLYKDFVSFIKSIIALVAQNVPQSGLMKPGKLQAALPVHLLRIPSGGVRFSLYNLLTNKPFLPGINEILAGVKLSLNPLSYIPPYKGQAFLIGGTELISFDGSHITVPSSCSYVLAEDYKDRNFSVVGKIENGALQSITLSTGKDVVELKPNSNPVVNGKPAVVPAYIGSLAALKHPRFLGATSTAGVFIVCSLNLDNCAVEVSGFYFGRLRGLFGNFNGEIFDEKTTTEGKIVKNTGEFVNSWKLHSSCANSATTHPKHDNAPVCTDLFTSSPMAVLCKPFVDPVPYVDACNELTSKSSDKEGAACSVSKSYIYACRMHGILIAELPEECAVCDIDGKKVSGEASVEVKIGNAADIVVGFDLLIDNERNFKEVVIPLVSELKEDLAKKGVSDVHVALVGGSNPYSAYTHYYSDKNGNLEFDPSSNDIRFHDKKPESNRTFVGQLHSLANKLMKVTGVNSRVKMYQDILEDDFFRPNAHKAIIGVHSGSCSGSFLTSVASVLMEAFYFELGGISYHVVTPFKEDNPEIAVLSESGSILVDGTKVTKKSYPTSDICVAYAFENDGTAINSHGIRDSPKKSELLSFAVDQISSRITKNKETLDCSCSLRYGVIPQPQCSVVNNES